MDLISIKEEINDEIIESKDNDKEVNEPTIEKKIKTEDQISDNTVNHNSNQNHSSQISSNRLRRGRKNRRIGGKVDMRAKLERSRQSARECRARKKLRYQYLEDLVSKRELANISLKQELHMYREICKKIDSGHKPQELMVKVLAKGGKAPQKQ